MHSPRTTRCIKDWRCLLADTLCTFWWLRLWLYVHYPWLNYLWGVIIMGVADVGALLLFRWMTLKTPGHRFLENTAKHIRVGILVLWLIFLRLAFFVLSTFTALAFHFALLLLTVFAVLTLTEAIAITTVSLLREGVRFPALTGAPDAVGIILIICILTHVGGTGPAPLASTFVAPSPVCRPKLALVVCIPWALLWLGLWWRLFVLMTWVLIVDIINSFRSLFRVWILSGPWVRSEQRTASTLLDDILLLTPGVLEVLGDLISLLAFFSLLLFSSSRPLSFIHFL